MKKIFLASMILCQSIYCAEPIGLPGPANACFMNATNQVLLSMGRLTDKVRGKSNSYTSDSFGSYYNDFVEWFSLDKKVNPEAYELLCLLGWSKMGLDLLSQQDAGEFLYMVLNSLTFADVKQGHENQMANLANVFSVNVGSQVSSSMLYQFEQLFGLDIPLGKEDWTLDQCIKRYFSGEQVDYRLDSGEQILAEKKLFIEDLQEYLIVNVKRQKLINNFEIVKNSTHVMFPLFDLRLAPYFKDGSKNKGKYDLKAFIMHEGSVKSGHYTAYVRVGRQWYLCNDSRVARCSLDKIERIAEGGCATTETNVPALFVYELRKEGDEVEFLDYREVREDRSEMILTPVVTSTQFMIKQPVIVPEGKPTPFVSPYQKTGSGQSTKKPPSKKYRL